MIKTREVLPRVLSNGSRDFQYIETLLDLVTNSTHLDAEYLVKLINPQECPSRWIEPLCSIVGYKYNDNLTPEQNRIMVYYYKLLRKSRGSYEGINLALKVYHELVKTNLEYYVDQPEVVGNLVIVKVYESYEGDDLSKQILIDLIEMVRPIGTLVQVIYEGRVSRYISEIKVDQTSIPYRENASISKQKVTVARNSKSPVTKSNVDTLGDKSEGNYTDFNVVGHSIVDKG